MGEEDARRLLVSAGWHDKYPYLKYYNLDTGEVETVKDTYYRNHWLSEEKSDTNPHKVVNLYDSINDRNRNLFENYGDFPEEGLTNYEHRKRKHHNYHFIQ